MPNPYFQVARTYLQRPISLLQRSLFMSGILILNIYIFFNVGKILQFYLFLFIVLFSCWAVHVKEQFTTTRASLTPGFRKVHGVVAMISMIVLVILLPGVTALLIDRQPIGLISITMLLFGIILWAVLRLGNVFFPILAAGLVLTLFVPIRDIIDKIVSGNEPIQTFIIISIGIILSMTGIIRLFLLNEEKTEYRLNFNSSIDNIQGLRRWFANRTVVRIIYHARHATESYWSRMQRWKISNRSLWSALFLVIFTNLFTTLINFSNGTTPLSETRIAFPTMIPIFLITKQFNIKSRFIARDLMMPVRKSSYLKELGSSLAFGHFIMWAVIMSVSVVWMFALDPKPNPEFLFYAVPYSAMIQIFLFGLATWLYSFRLGIKTFFIIFIAALFSVHSYPLLGIEAMCMWRPLILGVFLACLGLLLTWRSYRRWMVADLEAELKVENMGDFLFYKRNNI